ncbi:ComF family protein [Rhizobium rosettiformans]|uniref:ComF family protein n=1 Tax=Rhizobium rosettiformans TaxID=1368430 RepID=UPI002869F891|nr:ComF family protein [Rhizobium rosettiformans]
MWAHLVQKSVSVSRHHAGTVLRGLFHLVYPPACAHCHGRVARHHALCPACWGEMRLIEKPYCPVLGLPFAHDPGEGMVSPQAIAQPPVFDRLRSVALHEGVARHLVHDLKYRDRVDLAPMMAGWMIRAASAEVAQADAILAVPLHRMRMFRRMFNRSAELARHVARQSGKPFLAEALVRRKRTQQQVGLTANQRSLNVRGAFEVPEGRADLIFGKRLVLIDDVYTTGATVSAATTALKKAGAADVTVLTFARALAGPI